MKSAAELLTTLLLRVLDGSPLRDTLREAMARQDSIFLAHPFERWLALPDQAVIGTHLSTACYVQEALPAVLYLALKYHDQPERALKANTHLGGDNAHRGAILGALLGAEHGPFGFPDRWLTGLLSRKILDRHFDIEEHCDRPAV